MAQSTPTKVDLLPWVSFYHDLQLMIVRPRGVLDVPQVEKAVAMLELAEEHADKPFNRFTDLSHIDAVDLSFEFVFRISLHRRLFYSGHAPVKSAFYVTNEETTHVARTHALLTDHSPLHVKVFTEPEDAASWLGVSVGQLAQC